MFIDCPACRAKYKINPDNLSEEHKRLDAKAYVRCLQCAEKIYLHINSEPEVVLLQCPECESSYAIDRNQFTTPNLKARCFVCHKVFLANIHGQTEKKSVPPVSTNNSESIGHSHSASISADSAKNLAADDTNNWLAIEQALNNQAHFDPNVDEQTSSNDLSGTDQPNFSRESSTSQQWQKSAVEKPAVEKPVATDQMQLHQTQTGAQTSYSSADLFQKKLNVEDAAREESEDEELYDINMKAQEMSYPEKDLFELANKDLQMAADLSKDIPQKKHASQQVEESEILLGATKHQDAIAKESTEPKEQQPKEHQPKEMQNQPSKTPEEEAYLSAVQIAGLEMEDIASIGTIPKEQKYKIFKSPTKKTVDHLSGYAVGKKTRNKQKNTLENFLSRSFVNVERKSFVTPIKKFFGLLALWQWIAFLAMIFGSAVGIYFFFFADRIPF